MKEKDWANIMLDDLQQKMHFLIQMENVNFWQKVADFFLFCRYCLTSWVFPAFCVILFQILPFAVLLFLFAEFKILDHLIFFIFSYLCNALWWKANTCVDALMSREEKISCYRMFFKSVFFMFIAKSTQLWFNAFIAKLKSPANLFPLKCADVMLCRRLFLFDLVLLKHTFFPGTSCLCMNKAFIKHLLLLVNCAPMKHNKHEMISWLHLIK